MKITSITLVLALHYAFVSTDTSDDYKLELLQVLFRHGDRVPTALEKYEKDPYAEIFEKLEYGQLTTIGKKRIYNTGLFVRNLYNDFLGDYKPNELYAFSSDYDRTKMSLQLMLAGLYSPSNKTAWSNDIHWIPISTSYKLHDSNILTPHEACPKFFKLLKINEKLPEIQKKLDKFQNFFGYIKNKTGIPDTEFGSIRLLFNSVHAAMRMGLPLPNWCSQQDYEKLVEIVDIDVDACLHTDFMRRLGFGPLLEEFIKNIQNSETKISKRKIYLYGGHDLNVIFFEKIFNFTNVPKVPDYGSTLMIEKLRGPDKRAYIRMLLYTAVTNKLIPLKLENCDNECPLSDFLKISEPFLPNAEVRECFPAVTCHKKI